MAKGSGLAERLKAATGKTVREARVARGWSQAKLAEAAGTSQQTVDRIERGETLHSRALDDIREVLGLWRPPTSEEVDGIIERMRTDAKDVETQAYREALIPLYSMGFDTRLPGTMTGLGREADTYVPRAPQLLNASAAYAVSAFAADEMDPAIREGDILLVNPDSPLRLPCEVLLRKADSGAVLLRTLQAVTDSDWIVQTWSPGNSLSLSRSDWPIVHPVIGKFGR